MAAVANHQQAEIINCCRIALQFAIVQGDDAADFRQGVVGVAGIGVVEHQNEAGHVDHIRRGIGIGADDGLTQIRHTRGVVGTRQGVGEGEARTRVGIVIDDGAHALAVGNGGIHRIGDVDEESFGAFHRGVAVDQDSEGVAAASGRDGLPGERLRGVIAWCHGSAVGGGDVETHSACRCRCRQRHGETEVRGAGIAFIGRDIVDAQVGQDDRRIGLSLERTHVDPGRCADAGIGNAGVVVRARVEIQIRQHFECVAITIDIEEILIRVMDARVDGGAAGGETVVAIDRIDEAGVEVERGGRVVRQILHDAAAAGRRAHAAVDIPPHDAAQRQPALSR